MVSCQHVRSSTWPRRCSVPVAECNSIRSVEEVIDELVDEEGEDRVM